MLFIYLLILNREIIRSFFPEPTKLIQIYSSVTTSKFVDYPELARSPFIVPPQKSCAVVGNGGILLNSNYGKLINQHDFVIRSNLPAMHGYETDVGDKVNVTSINTEALNALVEEIGGYFTARARNSTVTNTSLINRLHYLNGTMLWHFNGMTDASRKQFNIVAKMSEHSVMSLKLAFSSMGTTEIIQRYVYRS